MRHVIVMSSTASVGLIALFVVDLVDMIFISMLGDESLVAAIGFASAILFFTTSVGIGLSIATGALVAKNLGAGDQPRAHMYASHTLACAIVVSLILSAIIWLLTPTLLALLGATGNALEAGTGYLRIIIPSTVILVMGMSTGSVLRGHGDANRAMFTTLAGGIVNAILDPIFIFALDMGLEGAAWASVVSRFAVLGTALWFVFSARGGLPMPKITALKGDIPTISGLAIPAILTNVATPVGQAFVTRSMSEYGDGAVAAMSIIGRMTPVAFAVIFALSGAIGPIVGQNFGAKSYDRLRGTLRSAVIFCTIYVLVMSLVLFLLRDVLANIFSASGETRELIYLFCGPLALMFAFNGYLYVANASFNNLGRPLFSTALNWGRNTIGMVLPVVLLSSIYGAPGVLFGQTLGGVFFGLFGLWLGYRLIGHYEKMPEGAFAEDEKRVGFWRALSPFSKHR